MDEKTLNALVNAIKNKDPKGLKAYENLQKIASSKPKNEEEQKNIEAAKGYVAEIKKRLTTKAAHGAKLSYIKSLKHICPEGEELVYFKKGGKTGCGCQKKETGGEVEKAENGVVAKFKKLKKGGDDKGEVSARKFTNAIGMITGTQAGIERAKKEKSKDIVVNGSTKQPMEDAQRKSKFKNDYSSKRVKDSEKDYLNGHGDHSYSKGGKTEKDCKGSKMKLVKKGDKVCPKCGKVHAAGTSCSIAKFKYRKLGGLL